VRKMAPKWSLTTCGLIITLILWPKNLTIHFCPGIRMRKTL